MSGSSELARTVFHDASLLTVADLEHSDDEERWFSIGPASNGALLSVVCLWSATTTVALSRRMAAPNEPHEGSYMSNEPAHDGEIPVESDFSQRVRGLHNIPENAKVFMPASIEKSVWEYFSIKAEQRGVELSDLLTEVLRRDIEINEALK